MKAEVLQHFIEHDAELAPHADYLAAISKPSVDITYVTEAPEAHESRFGGQALLPKGFVWPTHELGEYRFLGQINFVEIDDNSGLLPKSGLLVLLYAYDDDGEIFWGDDGYVLAYYYPNIDELTLYPQAEITAAKKLQFSSGIEIPRRKDLRQDWPFDTDALYDLAELDGYSENYLLGYPFFYSLAYDPTPSDEWMSLLTITSDETLDFLWHDGDMLMVFIEKAKLANADFSDLKADAG